MAQKQTRPATPVKTTTGYRSASKEVTHAPIQFVFDKSNYKFFIISFAIVVLGFVLMSGTTDIYSTTKIVVAPVVILAGFALGFYAILKKPSAKKVE
ncbi:MAG TPA: DUF3098 domain-containing protein [Mucilaginibacter sp.]|nr:DUF3098 domain-containing protein [Mucilaginibacter sp.]HVW12423.1 DUF3098 domain-containing protein [Mucilaginibacter sp.]